MEVKSKVRWLKFFLVIFGVFFIFGILPLMHVWPSGWQWIPSQYKYEQMIVGIYATLGVFLILAARNPLENLSLIWFTVWSSIVHGGIMLIQSLVDTSEYGHLIGDVPALFILAAVLAYFTPRRKELGSHQ